MTKRNIIWLVINCVLLAGCNFSKGAKTDLKTGLSFNYNGFGVQDVLLIDSNSKPMGSNKVQLNIHMAIVATGISNYALKDGKAYPGMMILLTDKNGSPVISSADLFNGTQGYSPANATELRGNLTIARPMKAGETYHVKMRIWDKVKPDNEINAKTDLVVM